MFHPRENRCRRFQANMFNKNKCQNCFKQVESHTLSQSDVYTTKPVKVGWLLLAPDGINFVNPAHKKRKWQRRYFILYDDGCLCYALDEMPSTLPQRSLSLSQCSEVLDVSVQTDFPNTLRLCFGARDYYIRTEDAENIRGWREHLLSYATAARTISKKRMKESILLLPCGQHGDLGPDRSRPSDERWTNDKNNDGRCSTTTTLCHIANRVKTSISLKRCSRINVETWSTRIGAEASKVSRCYNEDRRDGVLGDAESSFSLPSSPRVGVREEKEELQGRESINSDDESLNVSAVSSCLSSALSQLSRSLIPKDARSRQGTESGYCSLEKTKSATNNTPPCSDIDHRRSQVIGHFESNNEPHANTSEVFNWSFPHGDYDGDRRSNHSTSQSFTCDYDAADATTSNRRRSKSLERNMAEHSSMPEHLNFKKGWMTRLEEDGKWRKHWFVLTNQNLRFYRDAVAEEAADLDGEINLSTCYDITEFPVQTSYGFRIHTKDEVMTLCAMTSGIRRNWIQAVMKNIHPAVASDITCSLLEPKDSSKSRYPVEQRRSRISDRRKEGRYRTFDWAEFSHCREKREGVIRQSDLETVCGTSVTTAPVSSSEEPIKKSFTEKQTFGEHPSTTDTSLLVMSSKVLATKVISNDHYSENTMLEEQMKKADHPTSSSPATHSSCSVQTEWHWDEFQNLVMDFKAEQDRRKKEGREFKVIQAELSGAQDSLRKTELKLQKAEATLLERDNALQELRDCLQEVSEHLKATEEAHTLKYVSLERQLSLLQESQERERKCLNDSLNHAEQHGRELEERLKQAEAELLGLSMAGTAESLKKRCQELQHQLDESDSELSRLQSRLLNEETMYYDLEHNYERVCEELECVRGALQNHERVCEEHRKDQMNQRQQELNKKESELQEVHSKMAALGTELEMTKLGPIKSRMSKERQTSSQGIGSNWVIQQEVRNNEASGLKTLNETDHVISAERSLISEERGLLQSEGNLWSMQRSTEQVISPKLVNDPDPKYQDRPFLSQQVSMPKSPAPNVMAYNGILDFDLLEDLQEEEKILEEQLPSEMLCKILSLEGLVIQKMASALESPSQEFLHRLLELQVHPQEFDKELVARNYSEILASEADGSLDERDICNLCVKAELAYLTLAHIQSSVAQQKEANRSPSQRSKIQLKTKLIESSKQGLGLANISLPELVPYKERHPEDTMTLFPEDMESLSLQLRSYSRSLKGLAVQVQPQNGSPDFHPEVPPDVLRAVLFQATLVYVTSRLRWVLQHQLHVMQGCWEQAVNKYHSLEAQFQNQEKHFTEKLREHHVTIEMAELARESAETNVQLKEQEFQLLKEDFENKLEQIKQMHEEEMTHVCKYYNLTSSQAVGPSASKDEDEAHSLNTLKQRIKELEIQVQCLQEEIHRRDAKRQTYEQELETLKATCELGFSSMEQSHQRVIEEMQRQHQIELERLMEEKDRELQEETNATIAAIEAMRKAHEEQLEKYQKAQQKGTNQDIHKLHAQFKEEFETLHRELQVLSERYSQKCLENANLSQTVETERQNLISAERENKELHKRNQELSKCLTVELSRMQSNTNGAVDHAKLFQGRDVYQLEHDQDFQVFNPNEHQWLQSAWLQIALTTYQDLTEALAVRLAVVNAAQVMLRVKESEIQCLKQEIFSLKEELQASDRHSRMLLNELSHLRGKFPDVQHRAEAHQPQRSKCDVMKSKSNPDFLRDRAKQKQPTRSKSLRDCSSVQERMKIFESSNR